MVDIIRVVLATSSNGGRAEARESLPALEGSQPKILARSASAVIGSGSQRLAGSEQALAQLPSLALITVIAERRFAAPARWVFPWFQMQILTLHAVRCEGCDFEP